MARIFNGVDVVLKDPSQGAGLITGPPFTCAFWCRPASNTSAMFPISLRSDSNAHGFLCAFRGNDDPKRIRFTVQDAATTTLDLNIAYTVNTWYHVVFVAAASNDRRLYVNGGSKVTSSASTSPTGNFSPHIGNKGGTSPGGSYFYGDIGHVVLWNVALTDDEVSCHLGATGGHPRNPSMRIRRGSIVHYWPINGQSPEKDLMDNLPLTLYGSTGQGTWSLEPPMGRSIIAPGAGSGVA